MTVLETLTDEQLVQHLREMAQSCRNTGHAGLADMALEAARRLEERQK